MKSRILAMTFLLCLATATWAQYGPPFTQCPPVGLSNSCAVLIVITDSGLTVLSDTSQGTYDGNDDTLVGVVNNSSKTNSVDKA